jgi:hypothetical protein
LAVVTLNASTGSTLTGTFNSITSNAAIPNTPPGPQAVFTTCTLTSTAGALTATTPGWGQFSDPLTPATARIPLGLIQSVV